MAPRAPQPEADLETPEAAAERERAYREIFGIEDPKPRRDGAADAELLDRALDGARTLVARAKLWPASRPSNNSNDGGVAPRGR